jgi:hypothetical protein
MRPPLVEATEDEVAELRSALSAGGYLPGAAA